MERLPEAFGHRQDRDHRQVEDLGDLLELARQVALGTGLDLEGTIQGPFDDGELGVASPAEEERAADVGRASARNRGADPAGR